MRRAGEVSERDVRIPALDGLPLGATLFEPASRARQAVIVAPATGVKRQRYRSFARFLAGRGWWVVTFDYRGIGDSRTGDLRNLPHTMREWGSKDIAGVIAWIERHRSPSRLVAAAHSVGGQVLPFAPNHDRVRALVAIGCQKGYWKLWRGLDRYKCLAFWRALPIAVRTLGYLPMGFADCEDLPPQVALEWCRWGLHPDFIDAHGTSLSHYHAAFTAPILAYSFADDPFAPAPAVRRLLEFYRRAPREHRHLHPSQLGVETFGHSGFFTHRAAESLWHEVCDWFARPARPAQRADEDLTLGTRAAQWA